MGCAPYEDAVNTGLRDFLRHRQKSTLSGHPTVEDLSGKFQNGADLPCREVTGKSSAESAVQVPTRLGQQSVSFLPPNML
jgi:hypothetical protein